jgi:hypothetical protein
LRALEQGIYLGSSKNILTFSDFDFEVNSTAILADITNAQEAVDNGAHLLDAIYYFHAPNKPATTVWKHREVADDKEVQYTDIVRGLFSWFFSIFTQARHKAAGNPNFLSSVMGLTNKWSQLVDNLSSARIEYFPMSWIRQIDFSKLSDESRNRLSLGAAGHRYLQALTYIKGDDWKEGTGPHQLYVERLLSWTGGRVWWELHPATKSSNLITQTKSINKTIEDCLVSGLKSDALNRLTSCKVLYASQNLQPAHATWDTTDPTTYTPLNDAIFPTT